MAEKLDSRFRPWWYRAAAALGEGQSTREAAAYAGVHLNTVMVAKRVPAFQELLAAAVKEWARVGMKAAVKDVIQNRGPVLEDDEAPSSGFGHLTQGQ